MAGNIFGTIFGYDDYDEYDNEEREDSCIRSSNTIFISWSGERSKQIARELKNTLETKIFEGTGLECFVSDVDIVSGADWWSQIHDELSSCRLGIVCITKENIQAPWIYFESGAMIARDLKTIPLLFHCSAYDLSQTPLASKHMVDFSNMEKFNIMIKNINHELHLRDISDKGLR